MTDLDSASFLQQFKEDYVLKMKLVHDKSQEKLMTMNEADYQRAKDVEERYFFLCNMVASFEATLEQNLALKLQLSLV